jgi:4-phospho-D-threonate 3-dehydrogenase / 4-phospho-D-erythronate 3-dehydrogenase
MKPAIAITIGDPNGIGPEVALKAASLPALRRICTPVLVGPDEAFSYWARKLGLRISAHPFPFEGGIRRTGKDDRSIAIAVPEAPARLHISPGRLSAEAGDVAGLAIVHAVTLVRSGLAQAIVTAPVSKQALHLAGFNFPGQTEMLLHLSRGRRVAMMLVHERLRVGLATIHIPLRKVADTLSAPLLRERILTITDGLTLDWRIPRPHVALLALNPHAGEGGDIGNEEQRVIIPVMAALRRRGLRIDGPFPADAFFARYSPGDYDAVIAMYHDQGLIPLKMSARGRAVNVSLGLPLIRTSPDHGTGFDIAGKGIADPGSMIEAVRLAVTIARNRSAARSTR